MGFPVVPRPPRNRRKLGDVKLNYDHELEEALIDTLNTGQAIVVPLSRFHSSPVKGRLHAQDYRVAHRVLPDKTHVAAWVWVDDEPKGSKKKQQGDEFTGQLF